MEFVKIGKNYMIKNGNGRIITEKEKLELENKELIIKDIQSNECQAKTTQKITKNKKKIKKLENKPNITKAQKELSKKVFEIELGQLEESMNTFTKKFIETAPQKENADDIIKETDSTL